MKPFSEFYRGKKIFVTGHTGFKGAWLCLWLEQLGARVTGFSLAPLQTPGNLYSLLNLKIDSRIGDIGDIAALRQAMQAAAPEMVFHLAAQPLVLPSYEAPVDTFRTNIMGTVHVLECARELKSVKAIVNVTTDKCYENNDSGHDFCEDDKLGGHDPYAASKAAAEIVSSAYRDSFLAAAGIPMATARAGNVIGGGDFAPHRLIPDIIRAVIAGESVHIRHPESTRPWQHVLDVLCGYLMLGKALYEGKDVAQAFNFGPDETNVTVGQVADRLIAALGKPVAITREKTASPHEAKSLSLDNSKAQKILGWQPLVTPTQAIALSADWYREYLANPAAITAFTAKQLAAYVSAKQEMAA